MATTGSDRPVTWFSVTTDMPTTPPAVRQVPAERTFHGDTVTDEFSWLAEKENPDTIAYLEAS